MWGVLTRDEHWKRPNEKKRVEHGPHYQGQPKFVVTAESAGTYDEKAQGVVVFDRVLSI
jgi:hypothetical protein